MILHPYYKQTVTETNALVTVIDYIRSVSGIQHGKVAQSLVVLEKRLEILRKRAAHNRAVRGKRKGQPLPEFEPARPCAPNY